MEFERVRKLKYNAAKDIFYDVLNICYNFTYNLWYYCSRRKFCGCPLENGEESYCFICQIRIGYDIQEIEKIKNLSTIINVYDSLKKDIKKCIDFEPKVDHFWRSHYKTTCRSYGKTGQAYLKDYFENYIDISIGNM